MSAGDEWGHYDTACPHCGGVVEYWFFDRDCRGNAPSSGRQCMGCGKTFTREEWEAAERVAALAASAGACG